MRLTPGAVKSASEYDFDSLFGFKPNVTGIGLNLAGLSAVVASNLFEATTALYVPAIKENKLIIHLSNPIKLSARFENRLTSTISVPSTFSLVPQDTTSQWQMNGNMATIVLSIQHHVFTRTAKETFNLDSNFFEVMEEIVVEDALIYQIGRSIYQELLSPGLANKLFVDSLTLTLVIQLLRTYSVVQPETRKVNGNLPASTLRHALDYIHVHLDQNLSLDEIADIVHLSPYYFSRLFKQTIGVSVHQYVLQKRLELGKELLVQRGLTVTEAAVRTGFVDASHFSKHFKRHFGKSPVFVKNESKNIHVESNYLQDNLD